MQTLQVRLTEEQLKKIERLVQKGHYNSRSTAIRDAIRELKAPSPPCRILFTADLHGNEVQYNKLFRHAKSTRPDALIIGGDLSPKDPENRTPLKQRRFFERFLLPNLRALKQDVPSTSIILTMGNDDFRYNEELLIAQQKNDYSLLHQRTMDLSGDWRCAGYSWVPPTPFKYKDWERKDTWDGRTRRRGFTMKGVIQDARKGTHVSVDAAPNAPSIEKDIGKLLSNEICSTLILVSHAPPFNTNLDMVGQGEHVGSEGLRRAIEQYKPRVTLHGHIHETVDASGAFKHLWKETTSLAVGNRSMGSALTVIEFDMRDPVAAIRRTI